MSPSIDRRRFLAGSGFAAVGSGFIAPLSTGSLPDQRELYELRRYRIESEAAHAEIDALLRAAFMPAWRSAGIGQVGAFTATGETTAEHPHDIWVLLAFSDLPAWSSLGDRLAADAEFVERTAEFMAKTETAPAYARIESRLMRAFKSLPTVELPAQSAAGESRWFELRTYESPNFDAARRKIEMFDTGETQLMRDSGMGPVFFGETLVGHDVPNLTYMLSASDMDGNKAGWRAFLDAPEWAEMKVNPRYRDTVSKITKWYLKPTAWSDI